MATATACSSHWQEACLFGSRTRPTLPSSLASEACHADDYQRLREGGGAGGDGAGDARLSWLAGRRRRLKNKASVVTHTRPLQRHSNWTVASRAAWRWRTCTSRTAACQNRPWKSPRQNLLPSDGDDGGAHLRNYLAVWRNPHRPRCEEHHSHFYRQWRRAA